MTSKNMAGQQADARALFLKIMEERDAKSFSELISHNRSRTNNFAPEEVLNSLTEEESEDVWKSIFCMVRKSTTALLEIDDPEDPNEKLPVNVAADVIQSSIALANFIVDVSSELPICLYQMMVLLHGVFLRFCDTKDNVKNSISLLCEKFYIEDVPGQEELILNSSLYVLNRTLRPKGIKKDIKRVCLMKNAIGNFVKDKEHKECFMNVLKKCISSTLYLSSVEGVKFMEFLLTLDPSLIEPFHSAIKTVLPNCNLTQAEKYGVVYYNAWMTAVKKESKEIVEKLELSCIQDLMYYAIHVQRMCPRSLVPLLRKLLSVFHKNKKDVKVLKMLRELYQPVLWRALKSSNANARTNATQLFFDVFPLEDPDHNIVQTEIELQRQLLVIKELLLDECILVRSISAIGVCYVMACNWELITPEMVKTYLMILIEELSCDSSSAEVRYSVAKGLEALLVENQLAIPTLKVFLPKFQDLFHDISEKVRIAFCQLLLAVKKIRFIKFWEIVPVKDLLHRMDTDKPAVAKRIVQLLCNSYFPPHKPEEFCLRRCIELIKTDRLSSRIFFKHTPEFTSLEVIIKFMSFTCRMLNVYVESKTKKGKGKKSLPPVEDKENQNVSRNSAVNANLKNNDPLEFDDPHVIGGVIEALLILWIGIQKQIHKPKNKLLYKELLARFGLHLPPLLNYFEDMDVWNSVLMLCGLVPPTFIPSLPNICFTKLHSLTPEAKEREYAVLLSCICNQNQSDNLLDIIYEWLVCGLKKGSNSPVQKKKKGKKAIKETPKPLLGAKFLETLLEQPTCRKNILDFSIPKLKEIVELNSLTQELIASSKKVLDKDDEREFLFKTFSCISKIAVLLHSKGNIDCDKFIQSQLSWTKDVILKPDVEEKPNRKRRKHSVMETGTQCWKNLGLNISQDLLKIAFDMVLTSYIKNTVEEYVEFAKIALKSEFGPMLLINVMSFLNQLCDSLIFLHDDTPLQKNNLSLVQQSFEFVISTCESEQFFDQITESDRMEVRYALRDILLMQLKYDFVTKEDVASLIKGVLNVIYRTQENLLVDGNEDTSATNFTPFSVMLLSVLTSNVRLTKLSVSIITEWAKEDVSRRYVACLILSHVVHEGKVMIKSAKTEIQKFVEVLKSEAMIKDAGLEPSEDEKNILLKIETRLLSLKESIENKSDPPEA